MNIASIPRRLVGRLRRVEKRRQAWQQFRRDFRDFAKQSQGPKTRFPILWKDRWPLLADSTSVTEFEPHYTYHPAWAARILAETRPAEHVDISSHLSFCTIVSAFLPVRFYDYRPANLKLSGLTSERGDLLNLPFADGSIASLSCMHTVEHVGLGRYGDPIDPEGDLKAIAELKRVLAPGGSLLFVTPVGRPRLEFNAHRIYSYQQITQAFCGLELNEFALVPDDYTAFGLIRNAAPELADAQAWGCGCFWFKKPT